jgi:hypothetical protein
MLFYCRFTWYPGTTRRDVAQRVLQQHDAGTNNPERIKGWYTLAGGGAGFLLIEANEPGEISEIIQPYMDLMGWDVHAVSVNDYDETIDDMRKAVAMG